MTAHRPKPDVPRMQRMLRRMMRRYGEDRVNASYLRFWLSNGNQTDEDFQWMAEDNAAHGRWSLARFCRLMCFTSQTQRYKIG